MNSEESERTTTVGECCAPLVVEEVELAPQPTAVREARCVAARVCSAAKVPPEVCETAILLASELVTNAVIHAQPPVRMTVVANAAEIRVEVSDGAQQLPVLRERSCTPGGRGMYLVHNCASRWGVQPDARGKVVWFEIRAA